ncbi:dTDP-glucose 4,6-dehydratase [Paenibacillus sambharensis]|uniref:dTDP-glucose 4,6-dehydratase n=1 Tax=Paenibacillus sambharensis TaxID=1803190 RepID=A0A2W1M1S8_9BACL|nr:dTDP-glucose 4,6-dehydratase [Paenibacillus sambharensis]PZD97881.1 dTDP-glucose 4,6-dehydratase [Paenibacillus sambharensis]
MNIMVTGGAGFLGSNFIGYMLDTYTDCRIINFDKLTYAGNLDNLTDYSWRPDYQFVLGDICDRAAVDAALRLYEIEAIVHFAAESHVDRSIADPSAFALTNVVGTQTLLDAAVRTGVRRFVQISTDEVYGSLGDTGWFTEESGYAPNNPYSASKAAADMFIRAYYQTYGLHVNYVRSSNTYGPRQYPEKLIPRTITDAIAGRPVIIHGEGQSIRDWLYIGDNAAAIDTVLRKGEPGEIYNIGAEQERRTIDVAKAVLDRLGKPHSLICFTEDRPSQDYRYANKSEKIQRTLGWHPVCRFEEGLQLTIDWYVRNRQWWAPLLNRESSHVSAARIPG